MPGSIPALERKLKAIRRRKKALLGTAAGGPRRRKRTGGDYWTALWNK
jgi:hypothetical protein